MKAFAYSVIILFLLLVGIAISANIFVIQAARKYIFEDIEKLPVKQTGLVLGAFTYEDHLSDVLRDRVDAGISLKRRGAISKLLLSGDHGQRKYDETNGMKNYVLKYAPDISRTDIFLDHAGFDTYDSIIRAKKVFLSESMIIITQKFHIYRAVFIARSRGIDAIGLALSEAKYSNREIIFWNAREILARVKAVFDVVFDSPPKYLGDAIPISGDGQLSWD